MREEKLLEEFIEKYDVNKNLGFDNINYRKGASITGHFCLEEGFKVLNNGDLQWGYVRIHSGVDRGGGRTYKGIPNVIMSPFDFESSRFEDFQGEVYGTLVILISKRYGFEFRIAHMYPSDILILNKLKTNEPIPRDEIIGPIGNYGLSGGAHTHTEVKSLEEKAPVLEKLLEKKFGTEIYEEYTPNEILDFYHRMTNFRDETDAIIFQDYKYQKQKRNCFFANKYLYRYIDFDNTKKTRYSTELLWNGL